MSWLREVLWLLTRDRRSKCRLRVSEQVNKTRSAKSAECSNWECRVWIWIGPERPRHQIWRPDSRAEAQHCSKSYRSLARNSLSARLHHDQDARRPSFSPTRSKAVSQRSQSADARSREQKGRSTEYRWITNSEVSALCSEGALSEPKPLISIQ